MTSTERLKEPKKQAIIHKYILDFRFDFQHKLASVHQLVLSPFSIATNLNLLNVQTAKCQHQPFKIVYNLHSEIRYKHLCCYAHIYQKPISPNFQHSTHSTTFNHSMVFILMLNQVEIFFLFFFFVENSYEIKMFPIS